MFVSGGFAAARDITAITVNRWPHGCAPEYATVKISFRWHILNEFDTCQK